MVVYTIQIPADPSTADSLPNTIRFTSYNIQRGYNRNYRLDYNFDHVWNEVDGYDLIHMQECEAMNPLFGGKDIVHIFQSKTKSFKAFYGNKLLSRMYFGSCIFSSANFVEEPSIIEMVKPDGVYPVYYYSKAQYKLESGSTLLGINMHGGYQSKNAERWQKVADEVREWVESNQPVLIAGDFNLNPINEDHVFFEPLWDMGFVPVLNPNNSSTYVAPASAWSDDDFIVAAKKKKSLDHALVANFKNILEAKITADFPKGDTWSDHVRLEAVIEFD